jgi:hypothetical protein
LAVVTRKSISPVDHGTYASLQRGVGYSASRHRAWELLGARGGPGLRDLCPESQMQFVPSYVHTAHADGPTGPNCEGVERQGIPPFLQISVRFHTPCATAQMPPAQCAQLARPGTRAPLGHLERPLIREPRPPTPRKPPVLCPSTVTVDKLPLTEWAGSPSGSGCGRAERSRLERMGEETCRSKIRSAGPPLGATRREGRGGAA